MNLQKKYEELVQYSPRLAKAINTAKMVHKTPTSLFLVVPTASNKKLQRLIWPACCWAIRTKNS